MHEQLYQNFEISTRTPPCDGPTISPLRVAVQSCPSTNRSNDVFYHVTTLTSHMRTSSDMVGQGMPAQPQGTRCHQLICPGMDGSRAEYPTMIGGNHHAGPCRSHTVVQQWDLNDMRYIYKEKNFRTRKNSKRTFHVTTMHCSEVPHHCAIVICVLGTPIQPPPLLGAEALMKLTPPKMDHDTVDKMIEGSEHHIFHGRGRT